MADSIVCTSWGGVTGESYQQLQKRSATAPQRGAAQPLAVPLILLHCDMETQDASSSSAPATSMELTEGKGHTFFITCAFCFHLTAHLHNVVLSPQHHGSFHLPNQQNKRNNMRKSWYFPPSKSNKVNYRNQDILNVTQQWIKRF